MKRRLLLAIPLLMPAAQAMDDNAFVPVPEVKSLYTWMPDSLERFTKNDKRYLSFKGTTRFDASMLGSDARECLGRGFYRRKKPHCVWLNSGQPVFTYEIDCDDKTFSKHPDDVGWTYIFHDKTAYAVASTYCPVSEWSLLKDREVE